MLSLKYWQIVPIIVVVCLLIFIFFKFINRKKARGKPKPVAYLDKLKNLPSYKLVHRTSLVKLAIRSTLLLAIILCLAVLLARPQKHTQVIDAEKTRDIVFCMDISGSMNEYVAESLRALENIVDADRTDRFSIVLFQNAPFAATTLTRDTATLKNKAREVSRGLLDENSSTWLFTGVDEAGVDGTDIAAGLKGCLNRFDELDKPRTRHMVVVSDFDHSGGGDPLQAGESIARNNIKTHFMYPAISNTDYLTQLSNLTGASKYGLSDVKSTGEVVDKVYQTIVSDRDVKGYISIDNPFKVLFVLSVLAATWYVSELIYWGRGRRS